MILVTTAGKVGLAAAHSLAHAGVAARVLVRDSAAPTAVALRVRGVDAVAGDLDDRPSVDRALRGVDGVILVSPAVESQEIGVVDAARDAGVSHIVKITSMSSADSPIARRRSQFAIEQALVTSGVGYTLLRGNAYMQNLFMLAPAIAGRGEFGSSAALGRIGMVDARDVGEVAAVIARMPQDHAGQTYALSGPETISYADAAVELSRVLGRHVGFVPLTFEEEVEGMVAAGLPRPVARMNAQAIQLFAEGDSDWLSSDVERLLGRPPR